MNPCLTKSAGVDSLKELIKQNPRSNMIGPQKVRHFLGAFFLPNNRLNSILQKVGIGLGKMPATQKTPMSRKWTWMRSL